MSDQFRHDLEVLRVRSETLKQQATELFDQARALDEKIRHFEELKKPSAAEPVEKPAEPFE